MKYPFLFILIVLSQNCWAQEDPGIQEALQTRQDVLSNPAVQAGQILMEGRDPFKVPSYIEELELEAYKSTTVIEVDSKIEAIRRWPLYNYKLTAVIWGTQDPKALIMDKAGTMHMIKKNYRMGNENGIITAIHEGEIVVTEKGIPKIIKIENTSNVNIMNDLEQEQNQMDERIPTDRK